jgi:protein involved in polysaccharide export with SLBB domain
VSNAIQAIQAVKPQAETQPATQAPKNTQAGTHPVIPEDTVTISVAGKQAFAGNAQKTVGGTANNSTNKA